MYAIYYVKSLLHNEVKDVFTKHTLWSVKKKICGFFHKNNLCINSGNMDFLLWKSEAMLVPVSVAENSKKIFERISACESLALHTGASVCQYEEVTQRSDEVCFLLLF